MFKRPLELIQKNIIYCWCLPLLSRVVSVKYKRFTCCDTLTLSAVQNRLGTSRLLRLAFIDLGGWCEKSSPRIPFENASMTRLVMGMAYKQFK